MKAAAVILIVLASVSFAGNSGIQISPVTVDCGDERKEFDVMDSGGSARIWMNVPAGTDTDGVSFEILDQTTHVVNPTSFSVTACGDGWFYGDISLPAIQGTVTLNVIDRNGARMGGDSFRLE